MKMKRIILCIISVIIVIPCFFLTVSADSASITVNTAKPDIGKNITVNLNFSSSLSLYTTTGTLTFNDSVLKYVSGGASVSGSTISLYKDHTGEKNTSYSIVFQTISEGSSALDFHIEGSDGEKKSTANATRSIIVAKPAPSSNANLSALSVSKGSLSPAFSPSRTKYSVTVTNDVSSIRIFANVSDGSATFDGAGSYRLNEGLNEHTVTVTAPNGSKKSYTITIKRLTSEETKALEDDSRKKDKLLTVIDGADYHVLESLKDVPVPKNYTVSEIDYNGKKVSVLTESGNKYTLYCLKRDYDSYLSWYYLNEDSVFVPINYIAAEEKIYVIEDFENLDVRTSDDWYLDTFNISDKLTVDAYVSKDERLSDFCVLSCYFNGETGYFRYDKLCNSIQRYPDFVKILKISDEEENETTDVSSEPDSNNALKSFKNISKEGRYIILGLLGVVGLSIALIVLLAVKSRSRNRMLNNLNYENYESDDNTYE